MEQQMLRVRDVARALGVTPCRVYQLIAAGAIPSVRLAGAIRIPRPAWDAWLAAQTTAAQKSLRRSV